MLVFLPDGSGAIGVGLILLSVNAVRWLKGIPPYPFSITLGILMLVLGGLEIVRAFVHPPFDLNIFAILMIVLGLILLGRVLFRLQNHPAQFNQ